MFHERHVLFRSTRPCFEPLTCSPLAQGRGAVAALPRAARGQGRQHGEAQTRARRLGESRGPVSWRWIR